MSQRDTEVERVVEQFIHDNVEEDGTMYGRAKQPTDMLIGRLRDSVTKALKDAKAEGARDERERIGVLCYQSDTVGDLYFEMFNQKLDK